jgi:hypothetical protein
MEWCGNQGNSELLRARFDKFRRLNHQRGVRQSARPEAGDGSAKRLGSSIFLSGPEKNLDI